MNGLLKGFSVGMKKSEDSCLNAYVFFFLNNSLLEILFVYHTIHSFKIFSSMIFSVLKVVGPSPQSVLKHFHHFKKKPHTHSSRPPKGLPHWP